MGQSGSVLSLRGKVPGLGTSSKSEAGDGPVGEADPRHPSALVIVGPSGVGKGTLVGKLKGGNKHYGYSVSHTTREPRVGEKVRWPVQAEGKVGKGTRGGWAVGTEVVGAGDG